MIFTIKIEKPSDSRYKSYVTPYVSLAYKEKLKIFRNIVFSFKSDIQGKLGNKKGEEQINICFGILSYKNVQSEEVRFDNDIFGDLDREVSELENHWASELEQIEELKEYIRGCAQCLGYENMNEVREGNYFKLIL